MKYKRDFTTDMSCDTCKHKPCSGKDEPCYKCIEGKSHAEWEPIKGEINERKI